MNKPDRPSSDPCGKRDVPAELFAALRRLGGARPFETMSVREIAHEAGLSTRTFYNHFRSKYDLMIRFYSFDDFVAMRRARTDGTLAPWKDLVRAGLLRFRRDRAMFAGALRDVVGPEGFATTFLAHACRSTAARSSEKSRSLLPPPRRRGPPGLPAPDAAKAFDSQRFSSILPDFRPQRRTTSPRL